MTEPSGVKYINFLYFLLIYSNVRDLIDLYVTCVFLIGEEIVWVVFAISNGNKRVGMTDWFDSEISSNGCERFG